MARPLILVDAFPTWSETFVSSEIQGLKNQGVDCRVFALRSGCSPPPSGLRAIYSHGPLRDLCQIGLPSPVELARLVRVLFTVCGRQPRWVLFGLARIGTSILAAHHARRLGATSIHAHFLGATAVVGLCAACVSGLPLSLSPHASLGVFTPGVLMRLLPRARFTVACWSGAAELLSRLGPRVRYVPHGVDPGRFYTRHESKGEFCLLVIGRLVPKKGIRVLLDAMELISGHLSSWRLDILGDGPLKEGLVKIADRGGTAGRIHFHGAVHPPAVVEALRSADVLVVPSIPTPGETEGVPNVILEAFAAGVPVVASDTGGISEIVRPGLTGILVPPGDVRALASVLLALGQRERDTSFLVAGARELVRTECQQQQSLAALAALHEQEVPRPVSADPSP